MILVDKGARYRITLRHTDVEVGGEPRTDMATFMSWWKSRAGLYDLRFQPTGEDYGVVRRLLKQHGLDRLTSIAVEFWSRHSEPLVDGTYQRHMVLFSAKLAEAERDLATFE